MKVSGRANECHGGDRQGQWSGRRASRRRSSRSVVGLTSVTEEIIKVSGRAVLLKSCNDVPGSNSKR